MPTTIEAKEAKQQLARSICDLIREYEETYDVGVWDIRLVRSGTLSCRDERTMTVEVQVEV